MAHTAGAYPGFRSIKQLGIFLLPPGWDASPSQGYPQHYFAGTHLYTWVERSTVRVNLVPTVRERGCVRVKCLAQEHNAVPRPGLELRPSDPESSALTIGPQRLPHSFRKMRVIFLNHISWTVILDLWALTFNARIDSDS